MKKRNIMIPEGHAEHFKKMWQDSEGFWAVAAPGWCFDTLSGYLLHLHRSCAWVAYFSHTALQYIASIYEEWCRTTVPINHEAC